MIQNSICASFFVLLPAKKLMLFFYNLLMAGNTRTSKKTRRSNPIGALKDEQCVGSVSKVIGGGVFEVILDPRPRDSSSSTMITRRAGVLGSLRRKEGVVTRGTTVVVQLNRPIWSGFPTESEGLDIIHIINTTESIDLHRRGNISPLFYSKYCQFETSEEGMTEADWLARVALSEGITEGTNAFGLKSCNSSSPPPRDSAAAQGGGAASHPEKEEEGEVNVDEV